MLTLNIAVGLCRYKPAVTRRLSIPNRFAEKILLDYRIFRIVIVGVVGEE